LLKLGFGGINWPELNRWGHEYTPRAKKQINNRRTKKRSYAQCTKSYTETIRFYGKLKLYNETEYAVSIEVLLWNRITLGSNQREHHMQKLKKFKLQVSPKVAGTFLNKTECRKTITIHLVLF